ncbi:MAG TPA: helix-hairpin-helix domain-containing protein [Pyrinomonadaceae bacterium]|nr:helix-hairpin-helix domain-containing protein [Pyrinomonadaceae bacterium]
MSVIAMVFMACSACARLPRSNANLPNIRKTEAPFHLNINTASAEELESLPGVGKVIAERIVSYREQYGRFHRPEELLMVTGVSDKKFREIREMIVVE